MNRFKPQDLGHISIGEPSPALPIHPSDPNYPVSGKDTLSDTFTFLTAYQVRTYGTSFDQKPVIVKRNLKLLHKDYSFNAIKRAIIFACQTSQYPFSTKYLREILDTWKS
jgi:hypothetical protein